MKRISISLRLGVKTAVIIANENKLRRIRTVSRRFIFHISDILLIIMLKVGKLRESFFYFHEKMQIKLQCFCTLFDIFMSLNSISSNNLYITGFTEEYIGKQGEFV